MKKRYVLQALGVINIAVAMCKDNMEMAIFTVLLLIWLDMGGK